MNKFQLAACSASSVALALSGTAHAQDSGQSSTASSPFNEIIVTAQKTPELLQDTPIAITTFSQDELDQRSTVTASELQFFTPNFTHTGTKFGDDNFSIRGLGRTAIGDGAENAVSFLINQMFVQSGTPVGFYDLERVEVARGPQGTLFGRNSTGGAVSISTAKPTNITEGRIEGTIGSDGLFAAEAVLNLPLTDQLAVRFAGTASTNDGTVRNLATGNKINGGDDFGIRGSALWEPDNNTTVSLTLEYSKADTSALQADRQLCTRDPIGNLGCLPDSLGNDFPNFLSTLDGLLSIDDLDPFTPGIQSLIDVGTDPFGSLQQPTSLRELSLDIDPESENETFYATLEISHDFGDFQFDTVLGYSSSSGYFLVDDDFGSPTQTFNPIPGFFDAGVVPVSNPDTTNRGSLANNILAEVDVPFSYSLGASEDRQLVGEVRLRSDFDAPFNFLIGSFFLDYNSGSDLFVNSTAFDANALAAQGIADFFATEESFAPPFFRLETPVNDTRSFALFGEVYWNPTENLKLTGGIRWTKDRKEQVNRSLLLETTPFVANMVTFNEITWRGAFDWKVPTDLADDFLVYGSYSTGYKSGGFNPIGSNPNISPTFEPEFVDAFELGLKTTISNTLRANLAGFYYDVNGLQVASSVNRTTVNSNIDGKVFGLEAELLLAPAEGLTFNAAVGYLDTSIKNTQLVDPRDPTGGDPNIIAIKDVLTAENCVTTVTDLFTRLNGEPFGDCTALGLPGGIPIDLTGNKFANAPKWNLSLGAQYETSITDEYKLLLRGDFVWRSNFQARIFNRQPVDRIESWSRFNLFATIKSETQPWYAQASVTNLFDQDNVTSLFLDDASSGLRTNAFLLPPRTISFTAGFSF